MPAKECGDAIFCFSNENNYRFFTVNYIFEGDIFGINNDVSKLKFE